MPTPTNRGRAIISFVKREILNTERCILIVTHDARINEFADRILRLEDGHLTAGDMTAGNTGTE